jgi:hypothetical protein
MIAFSSHRSAVGRLALRSSKRPLGEQSIGREENQQMQRRPERFGSPRLQMCLLVAITGVVGFVASYALLQAGLTEMWSRYFTAFGIAYWVFLFLLWLSLRSRANDCTDVLDLSEPFPAYDRSARFQPEDSAVKAVISEVVAQAERSLGRLKSPWIPILENPSAEP